MTPNTNQTKNKKKCVPVCLNMEAGQSMRPSDRDESMLLISLESQSPRQSKHNPGRLLI